MVFEKSLKSLSFSILIEIVSINKHSIKFNPTESASNYHNKLQPRQNSIPIRFAVNRSRKLIETCMGITNEQTPKRLQYFHFI